MARISRAAPRYRRVWWDAYVDVNRRFAEASADAAAGTVRASIEALFSKYKNERIPIFLVSFLEGTRRTA